MAPNKGMTTNFFTPDFLLFLDPGSGIRDLQDPGSGMGKTQDPGSGIDIPEPQHCWAPSSNVSHLEVLQTREGSFHGANVFCFLSFLPLLPPTITAVFGSYLLSLCSSLTLYRRCRLAFPYDGRSFVGPKRKPLL
jgi:hypothetical protein